MTGGQASAIRSRDLGVRLVPLDPMLFGDNRSARAGEDHDLSDQDPSPITVWGAIGAWLARTLGADLGPGRWELAAPVLGPWNPSIEERLDGARRAELLGFTLCDRDGAAWFPLPSSLRVAGAPAEPVDVCEPASEPPEESGRAEGLPEVDSLAGARRLDPTSDRDLDRAESGGWISEELLAAFLAGRQLTDFSADAVRGSASFWTAERRVGLTVANDRGTARPGLLFGRPYRRFLGGPPRDGGLWSGCGLRAWYRVLSLPEDGADRWSGQGFIGGDRGRVSILSETSSNVALRSLRDAVAEGVDRARGLLLYLLTPTVARPLAELGLPTFDAAPIAAAIGKPIHVSGWNGAARPPAPRPVRTLLPAGSVLFYEWPAGEPRTKVVERLWLASLDGVLGDAGFGRVLPGLWGATDE